MTREEVDNSDKYWYSKYDLILALSNQQLDSESETCENCKYSSGIRSSRYNSEVDARHCTILNQKVEDNFGCNKFKRKGK